MKIFMKLRFMSHTSSTGKPLFLSVKAAKRWDLGADGMVTCFRPRFYRLRYSGLVPDGPAPREFTNEPGPEVHGHKTHKKMILEKIFDLPGMGKGCELVKCFPVCLENQIET